MSDQSLASRIDFARLLRDVDFGEAFEGTGLEGLFEGDGGIGETAGARLGELLGALIGEVLGRTLGTTLLQQLLDIGGDDGGE
ncbi:hypothetical protein BRC94_01810 [Halobacteriales archaeon QS_5_70_17]|nr:MAG: hypothetical protein BRC94_01810 [Halobacteriales archaeon QS_5_70_17]